MIWGLRGRGIIATALLFLVAIPPGCRLRPSPPNSMKVVRLTMHLQQRRGELATLKAQLFGCEAEIATTTEALRTARGRLDALVAKYRPLAKVLAEKLRLLQAVEEDLARADEKLAPLRELRKTVAEREKILKTVAQQLAKVTADTQTSEADLKKKTAALQVAQARLQQLNALQARFDALVGPAKQAPPDAAGKKK